jgi:hypothetical protein
MPNGVARLILFLSAYAPLLALFAILNSFHRVWAAWVCAGVAMLALAALFGFWRTARRVSAEELQVVRVSRRDEDVLTFFVTYVVPFAIAPTDSDRVALALLFFLALIGLLYLRAGMFRVHPVLLLCGLHLYELETRDPSLGTVSCFARAECIEHGPLLARPVAPGVYAAAGGEP